MKINVSFKMNLSKVKLIVFNYNQYKTKLNKLKIKIINWITSFKVKPIRKLLNNKLKILLKQAQNIHKAKKI